MNSSDDSIQPQDEYNESLPEEFIPGKWDVICQRGKECFDHGKRFSVFDVKLCSDHV